MKKLLILLLISGAAFGQRLGIIDQDTTKRPPTGLAALAYNNGVLKVIRPSGSSYKVITDNNTYTNPSWLTGVGATKLIDGSVSDAELGYINSLNSNAQTQLDGKSAYVQLSTYAALTALSTPSVATLYKIATDENKGISNSFYLWWPNGKRIWVAATDDN